MGGLLKEFTWNDDVTVVAFEFHNDAVFLNTGDGSIFISHFEVESVQLKGSEMEDEQLKSSLDIHKYLKPQEYVLVSFEDRLSSLKTWRKEEKAKVVFNVSDESWDKIQLVDLSDDECFRHDFLYPKDPKFLLYDSSLGDQLRTLDAKAHVYFYSTKKGMLESQDFSIMGIILYKDTQQCEAQLKRNSN